MSDISRTCKTCINWSSKDFTCALEPTHHLAPFYADFTCDAHEFRDKKDEGK